jgi:protein-tyrosine phosphatase
MIPPALDGLVARLLKVPLVRAALTACRAGWWRLRGSRLRAQPLRSPVRSILFVCKGNICRSPFAEYLCRQILAERCRLDIRCASAGIAADPREEVPAHAHAAAHARGVTLDGHRPTLLTDALVQSFDAVVVMEADQLAELRASYPSHRHRFALLALYLPDDCRPSAGYSRFNIADPYGKSGADFTTCYALVDAAVREFLSACGVSATNSRRDAAVCE